MKRFLAASLALMFYASILPWSVDAAPRGHFSVLQVDNVLKGEGIPYVDVRAFGFGKDNTAAQNKTAFLAAIASISNKDGFTPSAIGGTVKIPKGEFNISADILIDYFYITLEGAVESYGYGTNYPATTLKFGAGTDGIKVLAHNFDNTSATPGSANFTLKNIKLHGNSVVTNVLNLNGPSGHLSNVSVTGGTNGILFNGWCNGWHADFLNVYGNIGGYGVLFNGVSSSPNTPNSISFSQIRENTKGLGILGSTSGIAVTQTIIEANWQEGLYIYKTDATVSNSFHSFNRLWIEGNNRTGGYRGVLIDSYAATSEPAVTTFNHINMAGQELEVNHGSYITFKNLYVDNVIIGSTATNIVIKDSIPLTGVYTNSGGNTNYFNVPNSTPSIFADNTAEIIGNGTFADNTLWTMEAGWTITGGVGVATSAANGSNIYETPGTMAALNLHPGGVTAGRAYKCTFTIGTISGGAVGVAYAGSLVGTAQASPGTYSTTFVSTVKNQPMGLITSGTTTATVDNVSCVGIPLSVGGDAWHSGNIIAPSVPIYDNNAAAVAAGLVSGTFYRPTSDNTVLKIVQ